MKKLLTLVTSLFLLCPPAMAVDIDAYIHWAQPVQNSDGYYIEKIIGWDAVEGAEGYEVYLRRVEDGRLFLGGYRDEGGVQVLSGKIVPTNRHTIRFKTSGMYVYYTRAFQTINGVKTWSAWANSLDPNNSIVIIGSEAKARAWVIYVPFIK